jgi:hypothetical protein
MEATSDSWLPQGLAAEEQIAAAPTMPIAVRWCLKPSVSRSLIVAGARQFCGEQKTSRLSVMFGLADEVDVCAAADEAQETPPFLVVAGDDALLGRPCRQRRNGCPSVLAA